MSGGSILVPSHHTIVCALPHSPRRLPPFRSLGALLASALVAVAATGGEVAHGVGGEAAAGFGLAGDFASGHGGWSADHPGDPVDAVLILRGPTVLDLALGGGGDGVGDGGHDGLDGHDGIDSRDGHDGDDGRSAVRGPAAGDAALLADLVSTVAARQAPAIAAVAHAGARLIDVYDTAANALLVHATPAQLDALSRAPGVEAVLPAPRLRPALDVAAPLVGAREVVTALGLDGAGVNVAILDTGIDYTHCAFGGGGTVGDYVANDPALVEPGTFPIGRVVGGYDFAGSDYLGSGEPSPDGDPLDENGHGTHVASIAAGGCRVASALEPGIAPGANLVALKLFGRDGSTSLVASAIEWAIEANLGLPVPGTPARVDVINLSLGNAWAADSLGPMGAIGRAAQAGILVVASAGNSGPAGFLIGGPAADPDAIAVASTIAGGLFGSQVRVWRDGAAEDVEALPADDGLAPEANPSVRAPLVHMGRACDVDVTASPVAGAVALIERGTCTFHEKLANAEAEGAVAAIVYDDGRGLTTMGSDLGRVRIPASMIGRADGLRLRAEAASRPLEAELDADLDGRFERRYLVDAMSSFSSRGITRTGTFKPDIAAPGTAIRAAAAGTGTGAVTQSGTSMAAPMVSGAAAIQIQALRRDGLLAAAGPGSGGGGPPRALDAAAVGLMLRNAADPNVWTADNRTDDRAPLAWAGAGRLDVARSARARTLLAPKGAKGAITAGFHAIDGDWSVSLDEAATLTNLGAATRRYRPRIERPPGEPAGVGYAVADAVVELAPGASSTIGLVISASAAAMPAYDLADGASAANGDGRLHEAEHDAWLVVDEVGAGGEPLPSGDVVRLPIFLFARAASAVRLVPEVLDHRGPGGRALVTADNRDGGQAGRVELFTLLAEDPAERDVAGGSDVDAFGARVVGVGGPGGGRRLELAIHTRGARLAPYDAAPEVLLDLDRDGVAEWLVTLADTDYLETDGSAQPAWSGRLVTAAAPVGSGSGAGAEQVHDTAGVDVSGRWLVLRLDTAALGFDPAAPIAFDAVLSFGPRFGGRSDEVPDGGRVRFALARPLSFDEARRGALPESATIHVAAGAEASVAVDLGADEADDGGALLALIPTNRSGEPDMRILRPGEAVPTPTPTPSPDVTASASPEPSPSSEPSETPEPTPEPEPSSTASDPGPTAPSEPTAGATEPIVDPTPDSPPTPETPPTPERPPEPAPSDVPPTPAFPSPSPTPDPASTGPPATGASPRPIYVPLAVKRR